MDTFSHIICSTYDAVDKHFSENVYQSHHVMLLFNNLNKLIKKQTKFEQARYNSPDNLVAYRSCQ